MQVETFVNMLNVDFYTGVPDSLLKPLCNYLMDTYGIDSKHHMIAANRRKLYSDCSRISFGDGKSACCVYAKQWRRECY